MNYRIEKVGKFRKYKPIYGKKTPIEAGTSVKLIFKILDNHHEGTNAERLWVKVESINGSDIVGTIDNDPVAVDLKNRDVVNFKVNNIFDIES